MGPALRVAPEKVPLGVARRSFGPTKPLSSRLYWRFFRGNSDEAQTSTDPGIKKNGKCHKHFPIKLHSIGVNRIWSNGLAPDVFTSSG